VNSTSSGKMKGREKEKGRNEEIQAPHLSTGYVTFCRFNTTGFYRIFHLSDNALGILSHRDFLNFNGG
jgi:hypothetical protein